MYNKTRWKLSVFCITCLFLFCIGGCRPIFWIKKYRDMPDITGLESLYLNTRVTIKEKNFDLEEYYVNHYGKRRQPKYRAKPLEVDKSKLVIRKDADNSVVNLADDSNSGVKLTFIHLSDVQLRDEQVRLYDKITSKLADYVIQSFEHGPIQEVFDGAIYYAIIQTVNATIDNYPEDDPLRPLFMIHTGDAIDTGVVNELYEFLYITNELKLPWFNAIGNHDVGTFGNIKQKLIYVNDPFVEFMTMHSKFNFINLHHSTYEYYPFVNVSPRNTDLDYTTLQEDVFYSKYNGFDKLNYTSEQIGAENFICRECPGYYSIEVKTKDEIKKDPAIQMIVLDTGFMFGASGIIYEDQFKWLQDEIEKSKEKITLIFGHHNIMSIENGKDLKTLFASYPSVIAYFCGHTHKHKIDYHPGEGNTFGFWEVITGAIFAYPQQGSLVRVKFEEGSGFLEIYAFNHTIQSNYIGEDGNEHSSELFKHAEMAYAGAVEDISDREKEGIDKNLQERYSKLKFSYPKLK